MPVPAKASSLGMLLHASQPVVGECQMQPELASPDWPVWLLTPGPPPASHWLAAPASGGGGSGVRPFHLCWLMFGGTRSRPTQWGTFLSFPPASDM